MLRFVLLAFLLLPAILWADSGQYRSRTAVQSGEVMPLRQVLEVIEKSHPGQVLEVELDREHRHRRNNGVSDAPQWIYEIKLLNKEGQLQKIIVDAKTAEVLGVKQRPMKNRGAKHAHPNRGR